MNQKYYRLSILVALASGCEPSKPAIPLLQQQHAAQQTRERAIAEAGEAEARAELEKAIAENVFRPANTNAEAFTERGGRRTDDPVPPQLQGESQGTEACTIIVKPLVDRSHGAYIQRRLLEATQPRQIGSEVGGGMQKVFITGIKDLAALAAIIDFGTVENVDDVNRTISVKTDHSRLPRPEKYIEMAFGSDPGSKYTIDELIGGLTHWDAMVRRNACDHIKLLKKVSPADRARILEALRFRLNDTKLGFHDRHVRDAITAIEKYPAK